ncbi:transposase family protein [Streptomyces sp. NPDC057249]|uniref:transposase family protein n=1 Tax=Streptomyces sp. NPDC057249 TaxID=3346067 RepID=UPI00363EEC41
MNVQVVTDPVGKILWLSPALPGRTHDLTAARPTRSSESASASTSQSSPTWLTSAPTTGSPPPNARPPGGELTVTEQTLNRALSAARAPVDRGMARLKSWQIFRRPRINPNRMSVITKAVHTLKRQR